MDTQPEKNGRGKRASATRVEPNPMGGPESGHDNSLGDLFRIIGRWSWLIALVTASLVAAVMWFSNKQAPRYEATASILVGQNSGLIQNPGDVTGLQEVTLTMAEAVKTRPVAENAIEQLNLDMSPQEVIGSLESEQIPDTQFIQITYADTSPERAQQVVNAVGVAFSEEVAKLQSETAATAAKVTEAYERTGVLGVVPAVITATVWEQAETPAFPVSPNPQTDGLLALALGLMLGLGLAFLLEHRSSTDTWRAPDEVEQISGVPTLGIIPKHG